MGQARYTIFGTEGAWYVEHDGERSQAYVTKEAAFEAAVPPASNAIHAGHEVVIRVPGQQYSDEPKLGQESN